MPPISELIKYATAGAGGAFTVLASVASSQTSPFANVPSSNQNTSPKISSALIAVIVIILILYIIISVMLLMATYKLTDSVLQTILCFFFGSIYLIFAFIAYGFSGYKFVSNDVSA